MENLQKKFDAYCVELFQKLFNCKYEQALTYFNQWKKDNINQYNIALDNYFDSIHPY